MSVMLSDWHGSKKQAPAEKRWLRHGLSLLIRKRGPHMCKYLPESVRRGFWTVVDTIRHRPPAILDQARVEREAAEREAAQLAVERERAEEERRIDLAQITRIRAINAEVRARGHR